MYINNIYDVQRNFIDARSTQIVKVIAWLQCILVCELVQASNVDGYVHNMIQQHKCKNTISLWSEILNSNQERWENQSYTC